MQNTQVKHGMSRIKAFTLIESLVTLAITSFLILSFSGSITQTFAKVEDIFTVTRKNLVFIKDKI